MISLVIPIYNEEENIKILHENITNSLKSYDYEVIYVDDGSTDNSFNVLKEIKDDKTKIIKFRRNFGQTSAIQAGINNSKGDIIITLDADLQNDPADIPKLIEKYNEGYDLVSGWRRKRKDNIIRILPSFIANRLISKVTRTNLHDTGCTLKAYNGEILRNIDLFADHHRFIPAIFAEYSNKIAEIEVTHHKRIYGTSKYNILRVFRVIIDLISISYWKKYRNKPMYFWGSLSAFFFLCSLIPFAFVLKNYLVRSFLVSEILSPIFTGMLICMSILTFSIGLIFENQLRMTLKQDKTQNYAIENIL